MTDDRVARLILQTIPLVMRSLAARLTQDDDTALDPAHFRLLMITNEKAHTISKLAERQSVSLPTMSKSVTWMEDRGMLRRVRSPDDRRVVLIEITPQGRALLEEVGQRAEAYIDEVLQSLSIEERAHLREGIALLNQAFSDRFEGRQCAEDEEAVKS